MAYPGVVPASVGRRVLAYVIDALAAFLLGGAFLVAGVWQARASSDPAAGRGLAIVGGVVLLALGLAQWWSHARSGVTLGKALVGLRTLDVATGRPIGPWRVLLRWLVAAAGTLAAGIGYLVVLASPLFDATGRRQGWHDKAAGALVVDVVAGVDPLRPRAGEAAATARLDGLLAPVAAVDLEPSPLPQRPTPPPAPPTAAPVAAPAVPPVAAPAAPAVPAPAVPAAPVTGPVAWPPPAAPARYPADDATAVIARVPAGDDDAPPLEPTVLVDQVPGLEDDVALTRLAQDVPRASGRPVLRLWDGEELSLTGYALVGRNPARRDDEPMPERVIAVPDQRRSVSKTHLAVGVDVSGVWVRDRGSTNGTVVTLPDGAQVICAPGQLVRVPVGATVSFGDFWFTVA